MAHGVWTHRAILQFTIIGQAIGQQIVNVHHFEAATTLDNVGTTDNELIDAGADLITAWTAGQKDEWLACHPTDYSLVMLKAQILERNGLRNYRLTPSEVPATGAGNAGGGLGAEDIVSAAVLKWRTPQAGKSHRGRTYVGPVPTSWIADGRLSVGAVAGYQAYVGAMITTYGAAGTPPTPWAMTIYSRPFDKGDYGYPKGQNPNREFFYPEDYNGNSTNVTLGTVDPVVRSQRRRQLGVGA